MNKFKNVVSNLQSFQRQQFLKRLRLIAERQLDSPDGGSISFTNLSELLDFSLELVKQENRND